MTSSHSDNPDQSQEAVFRFLADPRTYGLAEPVGRVDTANAVVFLAGPDAYKAKRAVKFPFMDLSTLDKRRLACEAEIVVNRASAQNLSRGLAPVTRRGGTFAIGGDGEIVVWVVHMRRCVENAEHDRIADRGGVGPDHRQDGARHPLLPHARAPPKPPREPRALEVHIEQNDAAFAEHPIA